MTKEYSPFLQMSDKGAMKSMDFTPWGNLQGFLDATSNGVTAGRTSQLKRLIPWLARAESMTANAVSSLPFEIFKEDGSSVDVSTNWKNKIGGMPNPKRMLKLLAASLTGGAAYLLPERTSRMIVKLTYAAPHSMTPQINMDGLQYFDRATDVGSSRDYSRRT